MKEKKLLDALGEVDECFIEEACGMTVRKHRKPKLKLLWIAAAVLCAIALLTAGARIRIYLATSDLENYPLKDPALVSAENIRLTAAEVTATSMRIYCTIEGVEDGKDAILIQSRGPFTIEKKTDDGWEALKPRFTEQEWASDRILSGRTTDWPVDWSGKYGILQPGTYRYRTVVLEGKEPSDVEFTVNYEHSDEIVALLQATLDSHSYCVRHTVTVETGSLDHLNATDRAAIESCTGDSVTEYWKYGNQQLRLSYVDGQPWGGMMYKGELTYYLDHEGDDRAKPVIGWSRWTQLERNRLTEWVSLILSEEDFELRNAPDGSGEQLVQITQREYEEYGVTAIWTSIWELDTSDPGACADKLAHQDVNTARPFSWEQERLSRETLDLTFVNTQPQPITSAPEAVDRALTEYTGDFTKVIASRDEAAGMWKVEFQRNYGYGGYRYVYLNDNGITQMITEGEPKT